jgi:hypothetical protein
MWLDQDNKASKKSKWCGPSVPKTGGNKQPKWVKWPNPVGETPKKCDFMGFIFHGDETPKQCNSSPSNTNKETTSSRSTRNEPFSSWIHTAT